MLKQDLILRNPLLPAGSTTDEIVPEGGFGAVLSRAGVGKTALVVQLALNSMLRGKNVLHISLNDSIEKVTLWYREQFQNLARECSAAARQELWESILPHRFVMTFKVSKFSVPKLEERLADLTEQDIFDPAMIIIDGLSFEDPSNAQLPELKALAKRHNFHVWFTVHTHGDEATAPDGKPLRLMPVFDLFDIALQLKTRGEEVHIIALKGMNEKKTDTKLRLDPSTMLIKDRE